MRKLYDAVENRVTRLGAAGAKINEFAHGGKRNPEVSISLPGKERKFDLPITPSCPFAPDADLWARLKLIYEVRAQLGELDGQFQNRKGLGIFLEQFRLEQGKTESDQQKTWLLPDQIANAGG